MGPMLSREAARYFDGRCARGEISVGSARKMRQHVEAMIRVVGDRPARRLDKDAAEAWQKAVAHLNPSTQRLYASTISSFCEWLVDEDVLRKNPWRKLKLPKPQRRPPRDLTPGQVASLLRTVPDLRAKLIVLLMVQQGLRCGGVSSLLVEDVDLDRRWMRVREKGGHERAIWITDECLEALAAYLDRWPAHTGPLVRAWRHNGGSMRVSHQVASDRPLSPATISKFMSGWMYEAGVKERPRDGKSAHALRHTCATDMLDEGADITDVQETLGHADLSTTRGYTHVRPQRLIAAMEGRRYGSPLAEAV